MTKYETAILEKKPVQFLLGRGKYFERNRDWGGHDISATQEDLMAFATQYGESQLYMQLNLDIYNALQFDDISIEDLGNVISLIWWYYYNKKEGKLKNIWEIDYRIKAKIYQILSYLQSYGVDISAQQNIIDRIKLKFNANI